MLHLSNRLRALADRIPPDADVIDVGTDHAQLPVWLALHGHKGHLIASDIHAGPLRSAEKLCYEYGLTDRIELRLCDGLSGVSADEINFIVIAGMGGETMAAILSSALPLTPETKLLLQPNTKQHILRSFLAESQYMVDYEDILEEDGHLYSILEAERGGERPLSLPELYIGKRELSGNNPNAKRLLCRILRKMQPGTAFNPETAVIYEELRRYADTL